MKSILARIKRRLIRNRLSQLSPADLLNIRDQRFVRIVQKTIRCSPTYRRILEEQQIDYFRPMSTACLLDTLPILDKKSLFGRFGLEDLIRDGFSTDDIASVLTSSGHGGTEFAFGLSNRKQMRTSPEMIDFGLDLAFETDRYSSLLINCLPMGVSFQSNTVCIANVSVREDMALAIVAKAGHFFQQIILVGDPLFLKKLADYADEKNFDWRQYRVHLVIGEETFSESFRFYLYKKFRINPDTEFGGSIISSMGVAELGLNLFTETQATVALRKKISESRESLEQLFGCAVSNDQIPTFFIYSPLRTYIEILNPNEAGIGDLVVTMLDAEAMVPMIRYRTGDRAALVDAGQISQIIESTSSREKNLPLPVIALFGREKDTLPLSAHVDQFKEALYRDFLLAQELSGAFRLSFVEDLFVWEVQLKKAALIDVERAAAQLATALPMLSGKIKVHCFSYEKFPYGQTIDYERKFNYWQG